MKKCGYDDKLNFEITEQKTKTNNKNKKSEMSFGIVPSSLVQ